jgi:LysR family transcriptional regulator for metE and metH
MILEIRHLRAIYTIARSKNLNQAAQKLHLTPSALSHQIKTIENHFETTLFFRQHKPLGLTDAGQRLLDLAERVLPLVENTEHELKQIANGKAGRLFITIECHACFEWLLPTLEQYRKQWPDIHIDIKLGMSFDPLPALSRGEIDLVISTDPVDKPGLSFLTLFPYQALLVMNDQHPLKDKAFINAEDLAEQTLITYPVERSRLDVFRHYLDPANVEPAQVRQVELTTMMMQLIAVGQGVAALPDWLLDAPTTAKSLIGKPLGAKGMHGMLHAACRDQDIETPYISAFIELARGFKNKK